MSMVATPEAAMMRAFVQGALFMGSQALTSEHSGLEQPVDIVQATTPDGAYLPWFTVALASGIKIKVTFSVEHDPALAAANGE